MTVVEIWDSDPVENIAGCIALNPDRVVYVGFDLRLMESRCAFLRRVFEMKGMKTEVQCRGVPRDLYGIIDVLSEIASEDADCAFDALGGEGLILAAMGIVCERLGMDKISLHCFNVKKGKGYDCVKRDRLEISTPFYLTVEENAVLYGGTVKNTANPGFRNPSDIEDVFTMWDICRGRYPRGGADEHPCALWNKFCNAMASLDVFCKNRGGVLRADISIDDAREVLRGRGGLEAADPVITGSLNEAGLLISDFKRDDNVTFIYKNSFVRRCITKAGNVLECAVLASALSLREKDGKAAYSSCAGGVSLGWDDVSDSLDTVNEVDVMLMRAMTPVFISCKNGAVDDEELYKLDSVARRFGGKSAVKVLIATYMGDIRNRSSAFESFKRRAADMNIKLIYDADQMDRSMLEKILLPVNLFSVHTPGRNTVPSGGSFAGYKWRFM